MACTWLVQEHGSYYVNIDELPEGSDLAKTPLVNSPKAMLTKVSIRCYRCYRCYPSLSVAICWYFPLLRGGDRRVARSLDPGSHGGTRETTEEWSPKC